MMDRGAIFVFVLCCANSFVLPPPVRRQGVLFAYSKKYNEFDNSEDLENMRSQLEELIGASGRSDTFTVCDKPPCNDQDELSTVEKDTYQLTTIGRERRITEVQLLSALTEEVGKNSEESDAVVLQNLQRLWESERGGRAKNLLAQADGVFQQGPSSWDKAEERLLALIEEYDVNWVEPLHRLSMLYYLQKKFEKARQFAEMVVEKKPWHVQGLSNLVRILEAQRDPDVVAWASKRLPVASHTSRRRRWARQALQTAMDSLASEERKLQEYFGPRERPEKVDLEAWQ